MDAGRRQRRSKFDRLQRSQQLGAGGRRGKRLWQIVRDDEGEIPEIEDCETSLPADHIGPQNDSYDDQQKWLIDSYDKF